MTDTICNICNKDITLLGEEGCEDCGLEHDPSAPDRAVDLDFNADNSDPYASLPDIEQLASDHLDTLPEQWETDGDEY